MLFWRGWSLRESIGAHQGYIYCRAEYPLAVKRLNLAIEQARRPVFWEITFWAAALISTWRSTRGRALCVRRRNGPDAVD